MTWPTDSLPVNNVNRLTDWRQISGAYAGISHWNVERRQRLTRRRAQQSSACVEILSMLLGGKSTPAFHIHVVTSSTRDEWRHTVPPPPAVSVKRNRPVKFFCRKWVSLQSWKTRDTHTHGQLFGGLHKTTRHLKLCSHSHSTADKSLSVNTALALTNLAKYKQA